MICPACHNLMLVVEREKIELDYCPDCSGVWFDAGELELMLEHQESKADKPNIADFLAVSGAKAAEKERRCPICHGKMKKSAIGQQPKIIIDVCQRGDGLWFDGGEMEQLIAQYQRKLPSSADSQTQILFYIGDTLKAVEKSPKK